MDERHKPMQTAVAGAALVCASVLISVVGGAAGMYHSFYTIESERSPTPEQLFVGVRISVISAWVGLVVLLVGVFLVVVGLIRAGRARASPE